ncbi:a4d263eb-6796-4a34-96c4-3c83ae21481d [Sclerotinia trifoliorum]|uniref:A4d263eb-6796-4a34-96c4-3c83ae21481d n=1 Tax=Sclerotinia trifoliorum TaxID=28548 RepID=A0A8H2W222_9HELO|nr:a4d263eb-6796-4a34-96c4-3c83ae21481d [Sclerotinia trifoliorum]
MVGKVQGHRRRTSPNKDAAITGADSRSGDQTLNIQTPIVPVATVQVIQDVTVSNNSSNDQNEVSVEDSIHVSRSPKQCNCNTLPEENRGNSTVSSSPEDFSSRSSNMESYLGTPMIEHEFLWDFGSDEGKDVFNSVGLEKTSSVGTTNDSGYGDSEFDFSIHEVPTTINSHHDFGSPKRQRTSPVPTAPIPEPHLFHKRPHSESSDKQPQQPQTDTPWMSQSQLYTRPTFSMRHHNSYSGEINDYSDNRTSSDADTGFNRGFISHPAAGQTYRIHSSMDHMSQNTRDDTLPFTARSQHLPFPVSAPITSSEASCRLTSKCFTMISKLQKLLRDPSSLSLDVILATNKSVVSELSQMFDSTPGLNTTRGTSPEDYASVHSGSQPDNSYNISPSMDFTLLMIYVITLKHIHDLYSQACVLFMQHDLTKRTPSTPSPRNTSSIPNSPPSNTFGLPQLDFGTFKIDIADQRRLFSEIIAKELSNCLSTCTRVRSYFLMQPGDISAPTGLMEETFLVIEEGLQRMMKQMKI